MPNGAPSANADDTLDSDAVRSYLRQIGQTPLLTESQERLLAIQVAEGQSAAQVLAELGADTQQPDIVLDLRRRIADGEEASKQFAAANLRLVVAIAKKYVGRGLAFLDLVQEGNIGLMRAVEKFDERKGNRFSTYATWWIRQAVTRAIAEQGRLVRLPVHAYDALGKCRRIASELHVALGRTPTLEELAAAMEMPVSKLEQLLEAGRETLSLDQPAPNSDDPDTPRAEFVADEFDVADAVVHECLRADIQTALHGLSERERSIIELRYGLRDNTDAMTLEAVGTVIGLTRERVRQIEVIALRKLRHPHLGKKLRGYLET